MQERIGADQAVFDVLPVLRLHPAVTAIVPICHHLGPQATRLPDVVAADVKDRGGRPGDDIAIFPGLRPLASQLPPLDKPA